VGDQETPLDELDKLYERLIGKELLPLLFIFITNT
jgi:hypothetical protein